MEAYQKLEKEWAEFNELDPKGMVCCSSGTSALHLALEALEIRPCEVAVPDMTMIACARAVTLADCLPVFIDCTDDLLIDGDYLNVALNDEGRQVEAIMSVSLYGRACQAEAKGIAVVEDLAEAHGIIPGMKTTAACWSFYKNKIVAGEEGGAVWFRDPHAAYLARQLRSLGFTKAHDFSHVPRGHNYRLSNVHAELILNSLEDYEENVERRREVESWYDRHCPEEWRMPDRDVPWVYDLRIGGMVDRVVAELQRAGIAARHCFKPCSAQEEYKGCRVYGSGAAGKLSGEVIYLPLTITDRAEAKKAFDVIDGAISASPFRPR